MAKVELGLEVGSSAVRLAAVTRTRSGPSLGHIGHAPLDPGVVVDGDVVDAVSLTTAVRHLARGVKGATKEVHLGVVSQRMVARQVDLPWVPPREFKRALPLLAADCLPMPVEDCVLDFLAYEEVLDEDGTRVIRGLLVAAGEEGVQAMVDAVEAAGLRVVSVTLTPLSTLGAVADAHSPEPEALIDVGHVMTTVTIHEKAQPQFVRILSRGGRDITAALSEQLGITEQDAEIWKCALPTTWATMNPTDQAAT
jgi:type IV pilus assembly protein PilM